MRGGTRGQGRSTRWGITPSAQTKCGRWGGPRAEPFKGILDGDGGGTPRNSLKETKNPAVIGPGLPLVRNFTGRSSRPVDVAKIRGHEASNVRSSSVLVLATCLAEHATEERLD